MGARGELHGRVWEDVISLPPSLYLSLLFITLFYHLFFFFFRVALPSFGNGLVLFSRPSVFALDLKRGGILAFGSR